MAQKNKVSSGRGYVVLFGLSVVVSIFAVVVNGRIFAGVPVAPAAMLELAPPRERGGAGGADEDA